MLPYLVLTGTLRIVASTDLFALLVDTAGLMAEPRVARPFHLLFQYGVQGLTDAVSDLATLMLMCLFYHPEIIRPQISQRQHGLMFPQVKAGVAVGERMQKTGFSAWRGTQGQPCALLSTSLTQIESDTAVMIGTHPK